MTNPPDNICAQCRRPFSGPPVMLGKRLGCCTEACRIKLAPLECERLEAWHSLIMVKSRGMGADMASSALYSTVYPSKNYRRSR
jgi:hypothetical protein